MQGTAARKQKRRYITAEEALAAAERADATTVDAEYNSSSSQSASAAAAAKAQVIIDLRGPTPQLLAGADEISSRNKRDSPEGVPLGQELLHNVHMIVGLAEAELYSVQRQSKAAAERCAALERDAAAAKSRAEAGAQRLQRLEQVRTWTLCGLFFVVFVRYWHCTFPQLELLHFALKRCASCTLA